jgi:hypothetical protein
MKLLRLLLEEEIKTVPAEDIWQQYDASKKIYVSAKVYKIKKADDHHFEVFTEEGNELKSLGKISKEKLDAKLVPLADEKEPDAEGYVEYYDPTEIMAIQYEDDAVNVVIKPKVQKKLSPGNYIIKKPDGSAFVYNVVTAQKFEQELKEKS